MSSSNSEKCIDKLYLQRFSCVGDGMYLELCVADSNGKLDPEAKPYPIAIIRADKNDDRIFVIYSAEGPINIPLHEIERAILEAKDDVHSEEYFE